MDQKKFAKLVARADEDKDFLQKLVFRPETLVDELSSDVDRSLLGSMIARQPAEMVARTIGVLQACGNTCTTSCDNTCGGSCGFTTNLTDQPFGNVVQQSFFSRFRGELAACGNTCTSSCDNTCGGSCGFTTNLTDFGQRGFAAQAFR